MGARADVRAIALAALREWEDGSRFAENIIRRQSRKHALSPQDHAFLNAAVLAVLRNLTLLDRWIDRLRDGGKVKAAPRRLLRLGLAQLLIMGVPEHAAVNETVRHGRQLRGLVNAVMRRAAREREDLLATAEKLPPAIRWSMPGFLVDRWTDAWGAETAASICSASNRPAPVTVRVPGASDWHDGRPVDGYPDFFNVDTLPSGALANGECYAQDPATSLAPRLLAPQAGERVLDACAAPGGKAGILSELMGNSGSLIATDVSPSRCRMLEENLSRLGVRNARVEAFDWLQLPESTPDWAAGGFDRILMDVPCSNTGVLRRRVDVRWRLLPGFAKRMAESQLAMLENASNLLRPGGSIVYSTCSIEPEENRGVVSQLLEGRSHLVLSEERQTIPGRDPVDGTYCARLEAA